MTNMYVLFDLVRCLARLDVHVERAKKLSFCWIGPCGFKIIFTGSTFVVLVLQINGVWVAGSNGGTRLDAGADPRCGVFGQSVLPTFVFLVPRSL
jgi:hypothetical protein